MSKPFADPVSASVRSCPLSSTEEIRGEVGTPPDPPLLGGIDPVPIEVRRRRVKNGSRRLRDLVAVAEDDARIARERFSSGPSSEAVEAWEAAVPRLAAAVPPATFDLWLRPLAVAGDEGDTLILSAPASIRSWVERRYADLIREGVRAAGAAFSTVSFAAAEVVPCR
jgi:hypothetical protein